MIDYNAVPLVGDVEFGRSLVALVEIVLRSLMTNALSLAVVLLTLLTLAA